MANLNGRVLPQIKKVRYTVQYVLENIEQPIVLIYPIDHVPIVPNIGEMFRYNEKDFFALTVHHTIGYGYDDKDMNLYDHVVQIGLSTSAPAVNLSETLQEFLTKFK